MCFNTHLACQTVLSQQIRCCSTSCGPGYQAAHCSCSTHSKCGKHTPALPRHHKFEHLHTQGDGRVLRHPFGKGPSYRAVQCSCPAHGKQRECPTALPRHHKYLYIHHTQGGGRMQCRGDHKGEESHKDDRSCRPDGHTAVCCAAFHLCGVCVCVSV